MWQEIEQWFKTSAKEVEITNVKLEDLTKNKIYSTLQNQNSDKFIIKEINLTLTPGGTKLDSAKGWTVKPYV